MKEISEYKPKALTKGRFDKVKSKISQPPLIP